MSFFIRFVYKQINGSNYVFYNLEYQIWSIGRNISSNIIGAYISSKHRCLENTRSKSWLEFDWEKTRLWIPSPLVEIKCLFNEEIESKKSNSDLTSTSSNNQSLDEKRSFAQKRRNEAFQDTMFFTVNDFRQTFTDYGPNTALNSSEFPNGILTTDEGYQFELIIYPQVRIWFYKWSKMINSHKGFNAKNFLSIFVKQFKSQFDEENIWPLTSKRFTIGIVLVSFELLL